MNPDLHAAPIGLLLSGGLDSCILLGHLLKNEHTVRPLYIRSDLVWQPAEFSAVERFIAAMATAKLQQLVVLDLPLRDLYGHHWSVTGSATPDASTPDDAVYLPGRNALLTVKAALWCHLNSVEKLALAVLRSNPFSDASDGFFDQFEAALNCATGGSLRIVRPFQRLAKREVMKLGRRLPLELTFSCIAPVEGLHCGGCNKCAERKDAFRMIGAEDPAPYANNRIGAIR